MRMGAFRDIDKLPLSTATEDFSNSAAGSEPGSLYFRSSVFLSGILDSFAFLFFCLSFSSLTHMLGALWYRFSGEK